MVPTRPSAESTPPGLLDWSFSGANPSFPQLCSVAPDHIGAFEGGRARARRSWRRSCGEQHGKLVGVLGRFQGTQRHSLANDLLVQLQAPVTAVEASRLLFAGAGALILKPCGGDSRQCRDKDLGLCGRLADVEMKLSKPRKEAGTDNGRIPPPRSRYLVDNMFLISTRSPIRIFSLLHLLCDDGPLNAYLRPSNMSKMPLSFFSAPLRPALIMGSQVPAPRLPAVDLSDSILLVQHQVLEPIARWCIQPTQLLKICRVPA